MNHEKIFLIGFMGVGKTTLGKKIANQLKWEFVDLDQYIEDKYEMTITTFFQEFGETEFRKTEMNVMEEVLKKHKKMVISVGGGFPMNPNAMELMAENGVICYLQRPAKEIYQRVKQNTDTRPLLKDLNDEKLLDFIETKLIEREPTYRQADFIFDREKQTPQQIITTVFPQ